MVNSDETLPDLVPLNEEKKELVAPELPQTVVV
jgi:hypothetical protein